MQGFEQPKNLFIFNILQNDKFLLYANIDVFLEPLGLLPPLENLIFIPHSE